MLEPLPCFQTSIIQHHSTIIIGLSGGPDSIYLLYHLAFLQKELQLTLIAAHLDHEWQTSSQIAAQICKEHCAKLGIPLVVKKLSELKFEPKWNGSKEELGRSMRRYFFQDLAQQYNAHAIALAHHQQDQHETFFIRLLRGSSLAGLACMKNYDGLYMRPMLLCKKTDILAYLHAHNVSYYIDPTNAQDIYLRNKIRNHVIPALQDTDARFETKLQTTIQHIQEAEDFLEQHTMTKYAQITTNRGLNIIALFQLHPIIQQRIVLHMLIKHRVTFTPSQKFFKEIMKFLQKSSKASHVIHQDWMLCKEKNYCTIKKLEKNNKNL